MPGTGGRELVSVLIEKPGDRIGRYKLLQKIGEGGMGTVWMAQQDEPVRRRIALKVIKLGMDTKQVIGRFEAERQALALMDHPNIAKVLDAGATETGRPFFVMELVRGTRITEYCDQNNLATRERLGPFVEVCHAIQHAHQKGIIHRDIKPSNILVTMRDGVPVPKVIDFGIAKATAGQSLTDKTLFTAFEQFLGTPAYMSPEQAEMGGLDIDTRSDIYSLGVLLYELLTGRTPFDSKRLLEAGLDEIRRIIREEEPARPSTRLSAFTKQELTTVAKHRNAEPPKLISLVRGDLDWIVMRCLEKDRTRRYETTNALAMDVQRHLHDEPVLAGAPTARYRLKKFVRKHRAAVSLAMFSLLTCATFFAYEFFAFQNATVRRLSTVGEIIAANSTAALAFENKDDAREVLHSLKAEPHIVAASLYDKSGKLFASYPESLSADVLPRGPGEKAGYHFEHSQVIGFQPVVLGSRILGTMYLKYDMQPEYQRFRLGSLIVSILAVSLLAYLLSELRKGKSWSQ